VGNILFGLAGFFNLIVLSTFLKFWQTGQNQIEGYEWFVIIIHIIYVGLSIWLFVLGTALLSMRRWSRRGTVFYALIKILLFIVDNGVYILALLFGWAQFPLGGIEELVVRMIIVSIGGLFYPLLLLIFMQTPKVKGAFAAKERIS
jgi:hypothetical protein